jgi:hypothetical protein
MTIMFSNLAIRGSAAMLVLILLTLFPLAVSAQVEKRISFTKAKPTVTLKGKLPRYSADYDAYVFRARKGQTISIKLTTTEPDASFAIFELKQYGPDEDMILPANEMNHIYTGKLPITSEYAVQVYGKTSSTTDGPASGAGYTIEISLK